MAQFYADRVAVGSHRAITPEGYLLVKDVPIARTGFQTYRAEEIDKDGALGLSGLVDVYRPKEEVFAPATLASFEGKTLTCPHPPQFLSPDNDGHYYRGHVQNVRAGKAPLPDGEWPVIADILVKDRTTISQVESGIFEQLSAGYTYDIAPHESSSLDKPKFKQVNIRGNHVALVASGRAGDHVRVLDSNPEGVKSMEPEVKNATGELSAIGSFFRGLKEAGLRLVPFQATDAESESETVERQKEIAKKSNSMKERTLDMKTKDADELETEEKGAKEPTESKDKKAKDAEEEKEEEKEKKEAKDARRKANDALLKTIADGINKLVKASDAKSKAEDDDEKEEEKEKEEHGEDSDLIPVETLSGEEIPENPIPGADAAIAGLRKLRPVIAESGSQQAVDTFNSVMLVLKGKVRAADSTYKRLLDTEKPEKVRVAEDRARLQGTDSREKASQEDDFFSSARKFHRQNPNQVKIVQ